MGFGQIVKATYYNQFRPVDVRQILLPDAAGAAILVSGATPAWGVWDDVEVAGNVLLDTLVVGVAVELAAGVVDIWDIEIGSCYGYPNAAALAAVPAAVLAAPRANTRFEFVTAVGTRDILPLPIPVWIPAGTGIICRTRNVAGGDVATVTAICVQGWE